MNKAQLLIAMLYGRAGNVDGTEETPVEDEVDWGALFDEPKDTDTEVDPAPVETPPEEEAPNTDPQPEPVVAQPEEVKPTPEPEQKPVVETPTQPVEQPKRMTAEEFEAQRVKVMGELEAMYPISKDEADQLLAEPEKMLPKLAAQVHMNVMQTVFQLVQQQQQMLPQVVEQTTTMVKKKQEASQEFSARWPGLVDTEEGQKAALEAARLVRSRNPNASVQEVIEQSGRIAYSILGKDVPAKAAPSAPAPTKAKPTPHAPATTKSSAGVKPQQMTEEEAFYASLANN